VEPGKLYQCRVYIEGYDPVICSDSLPMPNTILKIEHIRVAGIDDEGYAYPAIKFTFPNNPGELCYYEAVIRYKTGEKYWRIAGLKEITDPVLLAEGLQMAVFSNKQIKGDSYTMVLNYSTGSSQWYPFVLELRSISYHYYLYLKQLYLYDLGRFPDFLSGVGNVFSLYSNVENGYGIFAGYSTFLSEMIYPE
jgi:hypothetical protein